MIELKERGDKIVERDGECTVLVRLLRVTHSQDLVFTLSDLTLGGDRCVLSML